jgi:hypothetical protein
MRIKYRSGNGVNHVFLIWGSIFGKTEAKRSKWGECRMLLFKRSLNGSIEIRVFLGDSGLGFEPQFHPDPGDGWGGFSKIEIGEGLTAFALSHHPAYGTVPAGSCSRYLRFVQIEEEKQALFGKETVR